MEQNTDENMEQNTKKEKIFKGLTRFFECDMKLKQTLLKLAPTEKDDFDEESRMKYVEQLYKELSAIEREFLSIIQDLELGEMASDTIKEFFDKAKESFLISRYEPGIIKELYKTQFSDMSLKLIENVKHKCIGYTRRANLPQLIQSSSTINELLHVIHSYIVNSEKILQAMPVINQKINCYYPIRLYGEETDISKKIFDEFPVDDNYGWTDIVSMKDKILMMIRDKGHALTIDIDISDEKEIFVKYFVPKLCNEEMIKALPGVNLSSITDNGATGAFATSKEELTQQLFGFIEKVPTDDDIPDYPIDWSSVTTEPIIELPSNEEGDYIFEIDQVKDLAMMLGENGRRNSSLTILKDRLKNGIKALKNKEKGNDSQEVGGNTNDETTRD